MKLFVVTQVIDTEDPVLGFFVRWVEEFAKHAERVEVICLKEGEYSLPANVRVHSLGKEHRQSAQKHTFIYESMFLRARYGFRFLSLAWRLRHEYDAVFVHMNQEYVLIAGWLWKLLGKRVYLWRNHYAGSLLTDVAAAFCTKVFCTSKYSYTAKYKKTVSMPVGVDTERFTPDARVVRKPHSILFLSRMSPSKRPEMLIDALAELARNGVEFSASFVGSPLPKDERYYEELKEKVHSLSHHKGTSHFLSRSAPNEMKSLADKISFLPGVPNSQTPDLYRAHEIFVNTSPSGMFDKTIFEAAASDCVILVTSDDVKTELGEAFYFRNSNELLRKLKHLLEAHRGDMQIPEQLREFSEKHSLAGLGTKLFQELQS